MRRSKLLAGAAAVAVILASGAAHAARVGVYIGGAPGYYVPAPYYYYYQPAPPPPPPPPPEYIERGPDGQPVPAPGPDGSMPYSPGGAAPYPPGSAPQYPQDGSTPYPQGSAPQYPPGSPAPAPQGADPQAGDGSTWYFCEASKTYYPYVKECASGWRPMPAQPATQQPQ